VHYILEVPKDKIAEVADMLRYDDCFKVEETPTSYRVHTVTFTQERWQSFGYVPKVVGSLRTSTREIQDDISRATGFTEGVRFAQKVLGGSLIQSE